MERLPLGPIVKVGGEVSNAVLFAYSNKGHEGFLGNSVLGEWCNLGADTNTSNQKTITLLCAYGVMKPKALPKQVCSFVV